MVRLPLQIATVGLSTVSMTRLKGSVSPVSSRVSRCSISASNLEKRSATLGSEPLQCVDQLADRLNLGLQVHRDEDVEFVFDVGDEIEDGEAVPLEVLGEARGFGDRNALPIEGRDQLGDFGVGFLAVGHARLVSAEAVLKQRNGARMGRSSGQAGLQMGYRRAARPRIGSSSNDGGQGGAHVAAV